MAYAILGAGVSGLSLAWFLQKQGFKAEIFEATSRVGGWIQSSVQGNYFFEAGPRSLRPSIETLKLIEELGLQDQVITPHANKRYLYTSGKLHQVPTSFWGMCRSPLMRPHLKTLLSEWRAKKSNLSDETIHSFTSRRLSPEFAEAFVDPLVTGIFAGDIRQLSIRACFPTLYQMELDYGSLTKAFFLHRPKKQRHTPFIHHMLKTPLYSFKMGLETLPLTLQKNLEQQVCFQHEVTAIKFHDQGVNITFNKKEERTFDHVFCAVPPHRLPNMEAPKAVSVACVHVGYNQSVLPYQGFGYLVPHKEKEKILGVVFDSSIFPEHNAHPEQTRLTVMMDGESESKQEGALEAIEKHLGIKQKPDCVHVTLAKQAIPQYAVGHHQYVARMEQMSPNMTFLGNGFYGVSVNDCIAKAKSVASI